MTDILALSLITNYTENANKSLKFQMFRHIFELLMMVHFANALRGVNYVLIVCRYNEQTLGRVVSDSVSYR